MLIGEMTQEEQGTRKRFHQLNCLSSKRTGTRTQEIIRLGMSTHVSYGTLHKKAFPVKLSI